MSTSNLKNGSNTTTPNGKANQPMNEAVVSFGTLEENRSTPAVKVRTVLIPRRFDTLTSSIRDKLKPGLDKSLQNELAALLNLIPELRSSNNERFVPLIEIAVLSLLSERPNLALARAIRKNIQHRGGGSPPTQVILGLGTLIYFVIPLLATYLPKLFRLPIFQSSPIVLVAVVGAAGSAISLMVRIREFERFKTTDPSILFFTGLFKPIIGMAFALFAYATLNSGLIPIEATGEKATYFFAAVAFVSGFSERFAKDIADRTEGALKGNPPTTE